MTIKADLEKIEHVVDEVVEEVHKKHELADTDIQSIIEVMQSIEDKFANLLAEFGVEIGDERVD